MVRSEESVEAARRLDELRRRLYRPDATEEDRRRYADALAGLGAEFTAEEPVDPVPVRRRRRLPVVLGVVATVAVVAGLGVALTVRSAPPPPIVQAADDEWSFPRGDVGRPRLLVVDVAGTAAVAQEFHGTGRAIVDLDVSSAPRDGRASISLAPASRFPLAWRSIRLDRRGSGSAREVVVARSWPASHQNVEVPTVFGYRGTAPQRVRVDSAPDTEWTLVVAFAGPATTLPSTCATCTAVPT